MSSMKVMVIKIKTCHLMSILTKLKLTWETWKIQLPIAINFISSKDTEEERVMHLNSDNIKFTSYIEVNEVVN